MLASEIDRYVSLLREQLVQELAVTTRDEDYNELEVLGKAVEWTFREFSTFTRVEVAGAIWDEGSWTQESMTRALQQVFPDE